MIQPRPYQSDALDAIFAAYDRGMRAQLLAMATGAGKTKVFAWTIERRPGRALVLAHRDRLIQQAVEHLSAVIPRHKIGIVKAEQNQCTADVVVASVQTLSRPRRLATMPKFDTVIVDEAHRSCSKSYVRILNHVRHSDTLLLGVTATPSRTDGIGLSEVYDEIVYQIGLLDLIEQGYLAPLRGRKIYLAADFSKLHTRTNTDGINDYKQDEVVDLMNQVDWYKHVTEGWLRYASDRRTIAFVPPGKDNNGQSTALAFQLAGYMRERGISAVAINGESPPSEQRRVLRDFESGHVQVTINCDLLVEGIDVPSANCILFARPTKSRIVYSQAIGRGSRLSPETGKTDCLVLDLVGASNRFDLCTLGSLFGLKELKDGEDVTEAINREKAEGVAKEQELLRIQGEIRAKDVNLFGGRQQPQTPEPQAKNKSFFAWKAYPEQRLSVLVVGSYMIEVWRESANSPYHYASTDWTSTFEGQTYDRDEAKAACEAEARRILFGDRDAPWRFAPASEKQIAALLRLKIPFDPDITKGMASDLLGAKFEKAGA